MSNTVPHENIHPFPAVMPGHSLVPARVGRANDASVIVYVECPNWCTVDHVTDPVADAVDISHISDSEGLYVRSFMKTAPTQELFAAIQTDPVASDPRLRQAHVVIEDGGNDYGYLTPEMAEDLADKAVSFASHLRHLARTARLHNTAGDSDPSMDEALQRVSGGAA
ncbi:hypothetical protein ACFC09_36180 [Streptomyces sp. NPDC056161]|uniref:DUF6907 domain-containing protein n=1 Tax=Streptomyces sp. NPDC056161 TaxID=3345732 RepID=UPI0035D98F63